MYRYPQGGFVVGSTAGGLAYTGVNSVWWIVGGVVSLIAGAFLVRVARRGTKARG